MIVGDDVPIRVDDNAGAEAALTLEHLCFRTFAVLRDVVA
jgi:hypothetical protein